jgi:predicted transcriptional regulator
MTPATVTIELPTQLYRQLQTLAEGEQADLTELLNRLVKLAASQAVNRQAPTPALRNILERATDLGVTDLSAQHDHYLYGLDKRFVEKA